MCGIVAILSRRTSRQQPDAADLLNLLDTAIGAAAAKDLSAAGTSVGRVDTLLKGLPGVGALAGRRDLVASIVGRLDQLDGFVATRDAELEAAIDLSAADLEAANAELLGLRDALWAVRRDRLRTAAAVDDFAGREATTSALHAYLSIQQALSAIDRMEVRGRDSAGIHVFVWGHGLRRDDPRVAAALAARGGDPLFQSTSVRMAGDVLGFVYKAAAEIGELGDNVRALRAAVAADDLLRHAVSQPEAMVSVLGHTRWASVGIISEPNCHPVNSEETERSDGEQPPYAVAVLNGDVDNHADVKVDHQLRIAGPITTDAKVIPAVMAHHAQTGADPAEAFRRTVAEFEGSVAIAASSAARPSQVYLALRGSGQALYVGLAEDLYLVASEPYGVVEETSRYIRVDGETASPTGSRGQVFVLRTEAAGELDGIRRTAYDGGELPLTERDVATAQVTTRDIDRGDAPHFLLKEISEAPHSFHKTLRGKIVERPDGLLQANVGEVALPADVAARLADGSIRSVRVIGQGTAAVAGRSMARIIDRLANGALRADPITATELSGFELQLDMRDTLIVAVSQSGTTTDTNRTVDLVRGRGAAVVAIVNRRNSDLTDKADGVMYTSDGRDVEMSVASTKAFYAQVAAGALLACAITEAAGVGSAQQRSTLLGALRAMPDAMRTVLADRPLIADAAHRLAPSKRYWAIVGNGPNTVAANEVRIKLSELCYKSIACDVTEDKKHIDLSSEPLILVCAAGLVGGTADDVAKEVAIYKAHKATPVVVATAGEERFRGAAALLEVPGVHPELDFLLSAMVGHLFGYEAALAIDRSALPLREARELVERALHDAADGSQVIATLQAGIGPIAERFFDQLRSGTYDGHLEASTAVRVVTMLHDLLAADPIDEFQRQTGKVGTPAALVDDVSLALTRAVDELTRPIDAIKHQAKTVTVGISRNDEGVLDRPLVQAVLHAGAGRDALSFRTLKVLADVDPSVEAVVGSTRYRIEGNPAAGATISVVERDGLSREVPSRVDTNPNLVGTKRRVATEREVLVARGRSDGRTVIFVPEVKGGQTTGITLLHVRFHDRLPAEVLRGVLQGYDRRYDRLVDWVSETEGSFREALLAELPVADLLILPISDMANAWRP